MYKLSPGTNQTVYTAPLMKDLAAVNRNFNRRINYKTDLELYKTEEFWTIAKNQGDCEDYALAKRIALIKMGVPPPSLPIATCWAETGGYHAVLICHTTKNDFVLDNRYDNVRDWRSMPYKWHMIQTFGPERKWMYIDGSGSK